MRTINALYDNLILLLDTLVGANADAFELTLAEPDKTKFATIITSLIDEQNIVDAARAGGLIYQNADLIIQSLNNLTNDFPGFLTPRKDQIISYLILFKFLIKNWTLIPNHRLRPAIFKLKDIQIGSILHKNYFYHDTADLANSVFLLTLNNVTELYDYLDSCTISEILILHVLVKLDASVDLAHDTFILIRSQRTYNTKQILSFVKFQMIMEGMFTHQPYEINHIPATTNRKRIKIGNGYHQFADTLMILSEYNYQKDLLDKYLRLYHVLENNMYRTQIVKVERESTGSVFSIREFQRLYKKITKGEEDVLGGLFKDAFELDYDPNPVVKLKTYIMSLLKTVRTGMTPVVINAMFTRMNLNIDVNTVTNGSLLSFYTSVVYKFRNSMVHNRETEFHLMHETLSNDIKRFIEQFLIPTMEEMVILLTVERNSVVWYTNPHISVYQE
ncbi:hypothetical protein LLH06_08035 [Mucilaginibacter daejeonensis]|uniref:hypothetical protein n=1 Tax=Mucilaginibacter daejeonensis TaxID=398049 RepID=UPI001D172B95|nr:hypothetical protein [Mucilaginibacter daejeonensis]UEG54913.1 hypothetical protein LLH06_08035 [Mucilaginibacter daejeonensis]